MEYVAIFLGNPGREYECTRHNLGFWTAERLADQLRIHFASSTGPYDYTRKMLRGEPLHLVRPTTFMNLSGDAVRHVAEQHRLTSSQTLVICDDFALPAGQIRIRAKGSDGGHNGLASIISTLGTTRFPRIRLGVGPVPPDVDPADFVLAKIEEIRINMFRDLADRAAEAVVDFVTRGFGFAARKHNQRPSAPSDKPNGAE